MTMTLGQVRDRLRAPALMFDSDRRELADAIDAHMAGMGEPIGVLRIKRDDTSQYGKTAKFHYADACMELPVGDNEVFASPPIDLAAVREVIVELNGYCEASDGSCYGTLATTLVRNYMDKLEAAMLKEAK